MIRAFLEWLDDRTGIRSLVHEALFERVPGGARWRYVWGSTLVFAFAVQTITGLFLWMAYSPSRQTAWESVYFVQCEMTLGWLLRGLHHYMAHAMVVLLALHLMQVVIDGAYRAPREVNFWLGLILMQIVLGLALTGYLLPWDQKGFWATGVATNIMGLTPQVGQELQQLVVGGKSYGHHTLSRFFALHAGVLPALLVGFLVLHVTIFRRHGLCAKEPYRKPDCYFWPDQVLKDSVACLAVLIVVLLLIVRPVLPIVGSHSIAEVTSAAHPGDYLGAELGPPADPANEYSAARPEWYFLFLFQFLKLFSGMGEAGERIGAIYAPGAIMLVLFLMPIVGRWKLGHLFNVGFLLCLFVGIAFLTAQAMYDDRVAAWFPNKAFDEGNDVGRQHYEASKKYLEAVETTEHDGRRIRELARANRGIPVSGALSLLREDPQTEGPRLFARHCAACHSHATADGTGIPAQPPSAPNLVGFGSREWIAGLLDKARIVGPDYFGNTKHKDGEMCRFVKDEFNPEHTAKVSAALSAEASLPGQAEADQRDAAIIAEGRALLTGDAGCINCHKFHDQGEELAPELTGYASREWLAGMISDPTHKRFYGENNDRMPSFAKSANPQENRVSALDLGILVSFLRGEPYEPAAATSHSEAVAVAAAATE